MSDMEIFRRETRAWLEENCPPEMRTPSTSESDICWGGRTFRFASQAQRTWMERMAARGWTVPDWPREYGGGGLTAAESKILRQEMQALGCRSPLDSFGIWMLGPALLRYGSEAQKREHLPRIARGEIRWCQGYSEPNAGSDLASLATRAQVQDDQFVINGQKIWTSYADQSDWIFCLVRTDSTKKHEGISFVLFDMNTPGVTARPIELISGKSPFCETYFDNVKVPMANLVGELNAGWTIAKYLLTHEREMIGRMMDEETGIALGKSAAKWMGLDAQGRLPDAALRADIARAEADEAAFRAMKQLFAERARRGEAHPAYSSALKFYGAELNKRRYELAMAAAGSDALQWDGELASDWLRSKGNSIEGGTSEVQLNVIAKRILDLPGA
jgi:acyl-CoA dehydrogenase